MAIGWSGQWQAIFDGTDNDVQIRAGLENTEFRLRPGEDTHRFYRHAQLHRRSERGTHQVQTILQGALLHYW